MGGFFFAKSLNKMSPLLQDQYLIGELFLWLLVH